VRKKVKVGVKRGGGPPPGYRWTVLILDDSFQETMTFLTEDQYQHVRMQFQEMAREIDPTHSKTASVDAVEDFHEFRDKGGILGGINIRVYFFLHKPTSSLVVLGAINKKKDGQTPNAVRIRMARRKRRFISGDYSGP
jgi:hypothetical protein